MAYNRIAAIGKATLNVTGSDLANPTILQTMDNVICFCGNIANISSCAQFGAIMTLPSVISKPPRDILFPAVYRNNGTWGVGIFYLDTTGVVRTRQTLTNCQIFLDGLAVHINDTFYNNTIGNNDESIMTSPIMWK